MIFIYTKQGQVNLKGWLFNPLIYFECMMPGPKPNQWWASDGDIRRNTVMAQSGCLFHISDTRQNWLSCKYYPENCNSKSLLSTWHDAPRCRHVSHESIATVTNDNIEKLQEFGTTFYPTLLTWLPTNTNKRDHTLEKSTNFNMESC